MNAIFFYLNTPFLNKGWEQVKRLKVDRNLTQQYNNEISEKWQNSKPLGINKWSNGQLEIFLKKKDIID